MYIIKPVLTLYPVVLKVYVPPENTSFKGQSVGLKGTKEHISFAMSLMTLFIPLPI